MAGMGRPVGCLSRGRIANWHFPIANACNSCYSAYMNLHIRNVPDELAKKLKVLAAQKGMTLRDYVLAQLSGSAPYPAASIPAVYRQPVDTNETAREPLWKDAKRKTL